MDAKQLFWLETKVLRGLHALLASLTQEEVSVLMSCARGCEKAEAQEESLFDTHDERDCPICRQVFSPESVPEDHPEISQERAEVVIESVLTRATPFVECALVSLFRISEGFKNKPEEPSGTGDQEK